MKYWIVDTDDNGYQYWQDRGYDCDASSGYYTGLQASQADAYDLVTAAESLTIHCYGSAADTTAVTVTGWTTSTDYTLTIQQHPDHAHGGVWDDSKYRLSLGDNFSGGGLNLDMTVHVVGMQIEGADAYQGLVHINSSSADVAMDRCYIRQPPTNSQTSARGIYAQNFNTFIGNNIILYGFSQYGVYAYIPGAEINNSTAYGCDIGFYGRNSSNLITTTNSIAIGGTTCFENCTGDNNVSSDTTAPGTNTVHSFDHSTLFPNAATGDFRPAIPYVDAFGETWGAGAIPWQRDVVVDTSATGTDSWTVASDELFVTPTLDAGWTDNHDGSFDFVGSEATAFLTITTPITIGAYYRLKATISNFTGSGSHSAGFSSSGFSDSSRYLTADGEIYTNIIATGTVLRAYVFGCNTITFTNISVHEVTAGADGQIDSTGIYTSLAAAEAGEQLIGDDLALRNECLVISCTSGGTTTADTTAVTIDADWNTSETCDFTVQGEAAGVWDDTKYNLLSSNGVQISAKNIHLLNTQIISSGSVGAVRYYSNTDKCSISGCYISGSGTSEGLISYGATINIYNNVFFDCDSRSILIDSIAAIANIYNNTIYNCSSIGIYEAQGTANVLNNLVLECTNNSIYSISGIEDYNILDDGNGSGSNDLSGITVYYEDTDTLPVVPEDCVIFKSATDFRLVSHMVEDYTGTMVETNSAIGNGTYLYDLATDNAGKSRQPYNFKGVRTARAFDIGAWQAPAQVTYVVDTDGVSGDYSSLATAFAGLKTDSVDLVADNLLPTISCQASTGVKETGHTVTTSGISGSLDCFLTVEGDSTNLIWDESKYTISYYRALYAHMSYIKVRNMQMESTGTHSIDSTVLSSGDYPEQWFERLLIKSTIETNTNKTYGFYVGKDHADDSSYIKDCVIFRSGTTHSGGLYIIGGYMTVDNVTVYGDWSIGIYRFFDAARPIKKNCISITSGTDYVGSASASCENYISGDLTGDITGLSSTYFTDPDNGDFTPVASAGELTAYSASANSTVTVGAIPFVDEKIVDTGGTGDYSNLATWESYAQGAVVNGETARALCESSDGSADNSNVEISGFPTGVFCEVIGNNDTGVWDDSKYHIVSSLAHKISSSGVMFNKIQFKSSSSTYGALWWIGDSGTILNSIIDGGSSLTWGVYKETTDTDNYLFVNNCIFYDLGRSPVGLGGSTFGKIQLYIRNSTGNNFNITNYSNAGFIRMAGDLDSLVVNVAGNKSVASTVDVFNEGVGAFIPSSSNNICDDTSTAGLLPTINQDFTGDFVSATDFHTTDSPYELWGADAAYAGAFGDEPYEVVRVVDTDGVSGDYPSLNAALDYYNVNRSDLVTRNEKALINCQATTGAADTTAVAVSGITTTATNDLTISGDGWDGDYTRSVTNVSNITISGVDNVTISGLRLIDSFNGYDYSIRLMTHQSNIKIINNYIAPTAGGVDCFGIAFISGDDSGSFVANNLIDGANAGTDFIGLSLVSSTSGKAVAYNNAIVNCSSIGINTVWDDGKVYNNIVVDCGECFNLAGNTNGSSYNISSDGTHPTDANSYTATATDLFTDPTNGDFTLKTGSAAINAGTDLSAYFTDDITGATRTQWDIGAFLYVDLGGGGDDYTGSFSLSAAQALLSLAEKYGSGSSDPAASSLLSALAQKATDTGASLSAVSDLSILAAVFEGVNGSFVLTHNSDLLAALQKSASGSASFTNVSGLISAGVKSAQTVYTIGAASLLNFLGAGSSEGATSFILSLTSSLSAQASKSTSTTTDITTAANLDAILAKITASNFSLSNTGTITVTTTTVEGVTSTVTLSGVSAAAAAGIKAALEQADFSATATIESALEKGAQDSATLTALAALAVIGINPQTAVKAVKMTFTAHQAGLEFDICG